MEELSNSSGGFSKNCKSPQMIRGGSSSSSLVLDGDRGELVRAMVSPGQKAVVKAEKALAALKNHSEAERRRRERIHGHLSTLRSVIPGTNKMDKASLLAEVIIDHLKELRRKGAEATKDVLVPMDTDEVRVEQGRMDWMEHLVLSGHLYVVTMSMKFCRT